MLATFIIGLREGLEAALIVGIIAAFLKRNGRSLTPMLIGVAAAVLLSLGVGIGLKLVEQSLPQAAQEGMEAIIGIVAIVFVTGMVLWMNTNARGLKRELEQTASEALGEGTSRAMVVMAFLAVLKEGFETAVFLLATFSASTNAGLAATGAALGILTAVVMGYGLYTGGMKLNLGKFFSYTSGFLLLVAAGLVVNTLGTMREAGWLNAGQQRTLDLSWLAPPGSVQGALFTGVLGIPPYPVLIQVVGWFAYLVPMALYLYWPKKHRPGPAAAVRLRFAIAGGLAVVAGALFALFASPSLAVPGPATVVDAGGTPVGSITVEGDAATITVNGSSDSMPLGAGTPGPHAGVQDAVAHTQTMPEAGAALPATLTLDDLVALNGGRLPVGINPQLATGPFDAQWTHTGERTLWLVGGEVLDFSQTEATTLTLSGGGLAGSRTLTVSGTLPDGTTIASTSLGLDSARVTGTAEAVRRLATAQVEHNLWGRAVPGLLLLAALLVTLSAVRARRGLHPAPDPGVAAAESPTRRNLHVS
ncbi:iron uptake transporter permease EfeU [Micropruina sonneratiae]|uniref:iron uptake transporter permease EfeU n=1 Tax=Micropruina sonneratiae TaxID=2986940 RepID=UPI002225F767|nr:iron uptake transporter permease EfeU [Micropruina sp. KQZ13P-5]MCW3158528.1 FTR1 family protein [Micropruina sp. KQZ13P-5]